MAKPSQSLDSSLGPLRRRPGGNRERGTVMIILAAALLMVYVLSSRISQTNNSLTGVNPQEIVQPSSATPLSHPTDEHMVSLDTLFTNANAKIAERRAWLSDQHSEGEQFRAKEKGDIWLSFTPVLSCPWSFEKIPDCTVRHDGGKWLCGLNELHQARQVAGRDYGPRKQHYDKSCVVYSMGSRNEFTFETRIRTLAPGCEIHTFDPTVAEEIPRGQKVYDAMHLDYGFGGNDDPNNSPFPIKSLATIMRELNHKHIDILKVDVEGYEFNFLKRWTGPRLRSGSFLWRFICKRA